MDIVERLIAPGLSEHSHDADKEEAADEIVSLRARCASLEAERDGLKSKMLDLVLALKAVRDDVPFMPPHVVGRVCAALRSKEPSHE